MLNITTVNNIHQKLFSFHNINWERFFPYDVSATLWSHQHQQCHWTSPPVIISPPSFLSLVFHRYLGISFRDQQGYGQNLTMLGGRVHLYLRYFLVDPCPIVCVYVYLSMSVYNFFPICLEVSTKFSLSIRPRKGEGDGDRGRGPDTKPLIGSCSLSRIWMLRWLAKRQRSASRGSRQSREI